MHTFTLWIEAEHWKDGQWSPSDDNSDAIVTLEDGSRWIASFFSYANIDTLRQRNQQNGECLGGKYFWASDMILIDEISRQSIEQVVSALIMEGSFERVFYRCPDTEAV